MYNWRKILIFNKPETVVFSLLVIIVILVGLIYFKVGEKPDSAKQIIAGEKKYWAVFLTNEQVYFGHLKNLDSNYPQLTDVYYFILKKPLQGQLESEGYKVEPGLIKLGNEIHGPVDSMIINKDHILFVEQLKDDSRVVKAIKEYERGMKY